MNTDVVCLKQSQFDHASEALASAFDKDPMFRYFTPEAARARTNALKWFCKTALRYSKPYNHIYTTASDLKGIAAWLPPEHSSVSILRLLQVGLYALPFNINWSKLGQFMSVYSTVDEFHERDLPQPHWYLFMLGVAPTYQGQGIGGSLLQPILKQADSEGLSCYLETFTEQAVCFYQKHGFEVLRIGEFPGNAPRFWTMKREPQSDK